MKPDLLGEGQNEARLSWDVSPRGASGRMRDNARVLRRNQTPAEGLLWNELRGRKLDGMKFRRQVPVGRFIVDFLCLEAGLAIEADGGQHSDVHVRDYDDVRTNYLNEQGLIVLRFTNMEIKTNLSSVLNRIRSAAKSRSSATSAFSPLPRGRGAGGEAIAQPKTMSYPETPDVEIPESEYSPCASS